MMCAHGGALYAADASPPGVREGPTCKYDHHSSPTWDGKHRSTVRVSVARHRMRVRESARLQNPPWKIASFPQTGLFKAHCSDVICIQLLMWGLKSQAEI